MKDLENKEDIVLLVNQFYSKIMTDKEIGFFFTDVVKINLETHLPVICQFWESVLLNTGNYKGNPRLKHLSIDRIQKLEAAHFDVWIKNWNATVDELYFGTKAEQIKEKAELMKNLMLYKIEASRDSGFIQ